MNQAAKSIPKVKFSGERMAVALPPEAVEKVVERISADMMDRGKWPDIEQFVGLLPPDSPVFAAIQKCRWALPNGSWYMPEGDGVKTGRMMKPVIGYDRFHRKLAKVNPEFRETLASQPIQRAWQHRQSGFLVSVTVDITPQHGSMVHVSMSYATQDPTWDEIKQVRSIFFPPFIDAMMVLPKSIDYVNVQEHCFHIWQMPSTWGVI